MFFHVSKLFIPKHDLPPLEMRVEFKKNTDQQVNDIFKDIQH